MNSKSSDTSEPFFDIVRCQLREIVVRRISEWTREKIHSVPAPDRDQLRLAQSLVASVKMVGLV